MTRDVPTNADAIRACVDLVGRTGARQLNIGYLHDDVPAGQAGWFAETLFRGVRILVEDQPGPVEAADALCRRLLTGARCNHCRAVVSLSDTGAVAYVSDVEGAEGAFVDGSTWTAAEAVAAGQCRWRRRGDRWERGCLARLPDPHPGHPVRREPDQPAQPNRAARRSAARKARRR